MRKELIQSQSVSKQWYFGGSQRIYSKEVEVWGIYKDDILITQIIGSSQLANLALQYFNKPNASLNGWDKLITYNKTVSRIRKEIDKL